MEAIVLWLRDLEETAFELYSQSSDFFKRDRTLSKFLRCLADDESLHLQLMNSASEFLRQTDSPIPSEILVDEATKDHVEGPLEKAFEKLLGRDLTKELMLNTIVTIEKSEWNAIFLYAINKLKDRTRLFQHAASEIQSHAARIEGFFGTLPNGQGYAKNIQAFPKIWHPRFLIVDDDDCVRTLLQDLLLMRGDVETARNGKEALEKIDQTFFNAVVADIRMPQMNGLDLYKAAEKKYPGVRSRFVFCSGEIGPDLETYFRENKIFYLRKPFELNNLTKIVDRITHRSHDPC